MSNIDLKRRTKIVATIGPAKQSEEIITDLIKAGVTTFRLNFSHGDHNDHAERIKTIREVSTKLDIDVGILQDLQGPKIRLGRFKDGPVKVIKGDKFVLTSNEVECSSDIANVTYGKLAQEVTAGKRILLDLLDRKYLDSFPNIDEIEQVQVLMVVINIVPMIQDADFRVSLEKLLESDSNLKVREAARNALLNF